MSRRNQSQLPSVEGTRKVRGRPFQPGNPGRPLGSKNKATLILEKLGENYAEEFGQKMSELAKGGNVRALEFWLERLLPKRSGRPVELQLPKIDGASDVPFAMAAAAEAVSSGSITPDEASQLVHLLERYSNAVIASEFAVRLQNLETQVKMMNILKRRRMQ
jgi:hypothetical protein